MRWNQRKSNAVLLCAVLILCSFAGWTTAKYVKSIVVTNQLNLTIFTVDTESAEEVFVSEMEESAEEVFASEMKESVEDVLALEMEESAEETLVSEKEKFDEETLVLEKDEPVEEILRFETIESTELPEEIEE